MLIDQLSVFVENKPGTLFEVLNDLAQKNINIRAMSLADTADFGILRIIVNNPAEVEADLKNSGFAVKTNKVVACRVADVPGGLGKIVEVLAQNGINLEYLYGCASSPDNEAKIILKVDRIVAAEKALQGCLTEDKKDLF